MNNPGHFPHPYYPPNPYAWPAYYPTHYSMMAAYPPAPVSGNQLVGAPQQPQASVPAAAPRPPGSRFVKGALIGAAAAYLLTNEQVQQATIRGAVKGWTLLQGGIEEMKERFRDAEAELHASHLDE